MTLKTEQPEVQGFSSFKKAITAHAGSGSLTRGYSPEIDDLYSLYRGVRKSASVAVIEIGSGWSTLALTIALEENFRLFGEAYCGSVRHPNAFQLLSIDASDVFQDEVISRISGKWTHRKLWPGINLGSRVAPNKSVSWSIHDANRRGIRNRRLDPISNGVVENTIVSTPTMGEYAGQICHYFDYIPPFTADFIYLDGPDCNQVRGAVRGYSVDFMADEYAYGLPMSADVLTWEPFLWAGTVLVTDGRGANAQFLRRNLKRDWAYSFDRELDQHWFVLEDEPWGEIAAQHVAVKREFGAVFKP